ncbi:MAG: ThuA domain-containing protein [Planctomycetaceae bacterium]|nr:ThuA domain-containing protein [Planctomycetaceae bacterium]
MGLSEGTSLLTQMRPEHPISRGWAEYEIEDEYYLSPTLSKATSLLCATDTHSDEEVLICWVYERPGGERLFSTMPGHPYANFQREPFRRVVVNSILWAAGRDVPAEGANVAISDESLTLPLLSNQK